MELAAHKNLHDNNDDDDDDALSWRQFRPLFEESFVNQVSESFEFGLEFPSQIKLKFEQLPHLAARVDGDIPFNGTNANDLGCETEGCSATGAVIWDSSLVVARYFELESQKSSSKFNVQGMKCFELGAGCGLLSCVLTHLGASIVVATERPELVPLLSRNMELNCPLGCSRKAISYMWGETLDPLSHGGPFDFILAVDCIYDEPAATVLFESMRMLSSGWKSRTKVMIAVDESYKRPGALVKFVDLVEKASLLMIEIPLDELENDIPETVKLWSVEMKQVVD